MTRITFAVLALLCVSARVDAQSSCAGATTSCTATSSSTVDVQTAINTAEDGDTVNIPAGSPTWNGSGQCSLTNPVSACGQVRIQGKGIYLKGPTGGGLTITNASGTSGPPALRVTEDASHSVEIGYLNVRESNNNWYFMEVHPTTSGKPTLIHNNSCSGANCTRFVRYFVDRGVFYQNTFIATSWLNSSSQSDNYNNRQIVSCKNGQKQWNTAPTYGIDDTNGTLHLYIEDNHIQAISEAIDNDQNCRVVVRYNTFPSSKIGTHGLDTGFWGSHGARYTEAYENTFTVLTNGSDVNNAFQTFIFARGGSWRAFNNSFASFSGGVFGGAALGASIYNLSQNYPANLPTQFHECWGSANNPVHGTAGTNMFTGFQYPAPEQAGLGHTGSSTGGITILGVAGYQIEGLYAWNNTGTNPNPNTWGKQATWTNECGATVDAITGYIQTGRDNFNGSAPAGYAACDSNNYPSAEGRGCDYPHPCRVACVIGTADADPTVTITSPAAESDTTDSTIALSGTAADDVSVTGVTWANSLTGGSGSATGTTSWSIASVSLNEGLNPITVTASDGSAPNGTDLVTVFRDNCGSSLPYSNGFALFGDGTDWATTGPCFTVYGSSGRHIIDDNAMVSTAATCEAYTGQSLPANQYAAGTMIGASGTSGGRLMVSMSGAPGNPLVYGLGLQLAPSSILMFRYNGQFGQDHNYGQFISQVGGTPTNGVTTGRIERSGDIITGFVDIDGPGGNPEVQLSPSFDVSIPVTNGAYPIANGPSGVCALAAGRGIDDFSTGEVTPIEADTTDPEVTIDAPADGLVTDDVELAIGALNGTVTDDTAPVSCEFENDRLPGFVALNLSMGDWDNAAAIALATGNNTITVSCHDAADNVGTANVTVTRNAPDLPDAGNRPKRRLRLAF